jgi:signal transduction histidine kinase
MSSEVLKQVFLNLALNAAQAMDKGGRLEVRFSTAPGVGRVELLDSGPGIEPAMLGKIFDPFVTTRHKGTGLGLTIVHNIVTAHGGTVEISNRRDGGARAAVELPLWREKTDDAGRVEDGAVAPEA